MSPLLFAALLFPPPAQEALEVRIAVARLEAFVAGKHLVGLTPQEVLCRLGEPARREAGAWEYPEPLGPGAHAFRVVRVVRFAGGKVVAAPQEERPVGCILIERAGR
jgi:hypothetical protein